MAEGSGLIGRRIGAYEVLSLLGAGGMGEVYRARDARLDRDVALKIVRPVLAADPELMARLEREARVLATLSHPHIAAIYGIEDVPDHAGVGAGARALVLELVGGETLADRLGRAAGPAGGLPVAEAIEIASQIVSALDSAHERGIVHRDLKPANVKLTDDQIVKILDFGLAKTASSADTSHAPTITSASRDGVMLGTPAYMSPEQVRGKAIDKRSDIWAFGCLLFELLTGRTAFARATMADTISAILSEEPEWAALPIGTPAALRYLVQSCLTKDPRRRLRDIGDARLDGAAAHAVSATVAEAAPRNVHFQRLSDFPGVNESPAISPDGRMVAFVAVANGRRQLFTLLLSGGTPLQITRDDADHDHPRWAPDSSALLYHTPAEDSEDEGTLWEIPVLGGTPRPIVSALGGGDVSHCGRRIAFFRLRQGIQELVTMSREGSDPRVVTSIPWGHPCRYARWSPDDRFIAFHFSRLTQFSEELSVVPADGGPPRSIVAAGSINGLSWLPDGSGLVYSSSADSALPYPRTYGLRVIRLDGSGDRQATFGDTSHVAPDVHASGKIVVCRIRNASDIWRFPTTGSAADNARAGLRITNQTGRLQTPSVSPDGRELVFLSDNGAHANLWIARADGSAPRQLTFERDRSVTMGVPLWSPAGDRIAFVCAHEATGIRVINPNGRGLRQLVPEGFGPCWSRDGRWLYYTRTVNARWRFEKIPADGGDPVVVRDDSFVHAPTAGDGAIFFAMRSEHVASFDWTICRASPDDGPAEAIGRIRASRVPVSSAFVHCSLSPDGKWLAVPLIDGATTNIWALPSSGGPMRQLTDFDGRPTLIARQVCWSPDGQYLYAAVADVGADVVMYDGLI
jgi:serine/threonine protein kinase/sugar lactone lactonase YvrE